MRYARVCASALSLDTHADTGALTSSADWIMRCFNIAFTCYWPPSPVFHQSI